MKPPASSEEHLRLSRDLLASLAAAVPAVRCLIGRWSAVGATLDLLRAAADDLATAPSHPLAADLLASLHGALSLTLSLSLRCAAADPPSGKLRAQSELSAAAAELTRIADDADLLLRSGSLLDASGGAVASRRDASARGIVTRLQIGTPVARSAALEALIELLREDDKNALAAVANGAVPALARLLDSSSPSFRDAREKAVAAIARISAVESCRSAVAAEGVLLLNHLARFLDSGSARDSALAALHALTLARDAAMAVGSGGAIPSLLTICRSGTSSSRAAVAELRDAFLDEDAIPTLLSLLSSGTAPAQDAAMSCLRGIAGGDSAGAKLAMVRDGVLDCIKGFLQEGGGRARSIAPAMSLLRDLAAVRYVAEAAVSSGLVPLAVAGLSDAAADARASAAGALSQLASSSARAGREIGEAVPRLVEMMEEERKGGEREAAAMAVAALLRCCSDNRRMFRKEERGVGNLVRMLDVPGVEKRYAVAALMSVSQSRRCRRRMAAAGAGVHLRRLVGEVGGAKRLLDSLSGGSSKGGKIWGVFTKKSN